MTSRNLNSTWRDVLFKQYAQDYNAGVPFPIRYLLKNTQWKQDLWYEIPNKIEPVAFRRSIIAFHRATKGTGSPEYQDANIKVRQKRPNQNIQDPEGGQITTTTTTAPVQENVVPEAKAKDSDGAEPASVAGGEGVGFRGVPG